MSRIGSLWDSFDQHHGRSTAIATIFSVLVLMCYSVFAALQWIELERTNQLTRESLYVAQRAWVVLKEVGGLPTKPPCESTLPITVTVRNTGHTPATDLHMTFKIAYFHGGNPPDDIFEAFPQAPSFSTTPIGIDDTQVGLTTIPAYASDVCEAIRTGERQLYFFGDIRYRDVFRRTHVRRTEFSYVFRPETGTWVVGPNNNRVE